MSIDALVLLRIEKLALPKLVTGMALPVRHRGDASILSTLTRFDARAPDEFALALRQQLGSALDAHDDPRGILVFPDVCEFRGRKYDTIVEEVTGAGFWAPKIEAGHVPVRYTKAAPLTHDALVKEMIERMGRDAALEFDMIAQVNEISTAASGLPELVEEAAAHMQKLTRKMGGEFTSRYQASLREKVLEAQRAQAAHSDRMRDFGERARRGEPLISEAEVTTFLQSGAADTVLGDLAPELKKALEKELGALDVEGLPDGDLGKEIAKALKRKKS